MRMKNIILKYFANKELAKNTKFQNLHKGESCYIFGNGISLKSLDFEKLNDRIAIGSNSLFTHNKFSKLDCRYYLIPAHSLFFRYRKYYDRLQRNYIGELYRNKILQHKRTHFFTSLSNCINMRSENVSYIHHFGHKNWDFDQCAMDGAFSFMAGATYAMLGTAIYMGFKNAVLLGFDYTFSPSANLHFFEKGKGILSGSSSNDPYCDLFFKECQKRIDLTIITPDGVESYLKYKTYSEYIGSPTEYKENIEIVDSISLDYLNKQGFYEIY